MSDNQANPVKGAETDLQSAAKSISGLLNLNNEPKKEEEQNTTEVKQELLDSSVPQQEELPEGDQPLEQENKEIEAEAPAEEEVSEEVSQDENSEIQKEQNSTYKVKVAGQEFDVTLDELRAGYSRDADYRRKTEELSKEKKQFMSESEKQRQDYSEKLNDLNNLLSVASEEINSEFKGIDLERMYEEDPTEALRIEHKLKKKQEKLAEAYKKIQDAQLKQRNEILKEQQKVLLEKIPELSDSEKSRVFKEDMIKYLNSYGFKNEEIGQIYDHRVFMLVNDVMKYRKIQGTRPNLASKIAKPGKILTSGIKKDKSEINQQKRKEKFGRLKKSGSIKDAQSIFLDMITNKNK